MHPVTSFGDQPQHSRHASRIALMGVSRTDSVPPSRFLILCRRAIVTFLLWDYTNLVSIFKSSGEIFLYYPPGAASKAICRLPGLVLYTHSPSSVIFSSAARASLALSSDLVWHGPARSRALCLCFLLNSWAIMAYLKSPAAAPLNF